jgi:hypothetical protein
MESKYKDSKIYAIRSPHTNKIYIGSTTTKYLCNRLHGHKNDYKKNHYVTSCEIIKLGDAYIELLECFPCSSKSELTKREGELMQQHDCVNKYIAGRTVRESQLAHLKKNKDAINLKQKLKARERRANQMLQ